MHNDVRQDEALKTQGVCVCTHLNMVTDGAFSRSKSAVNSRQGAQARLGYLCQRSYSKMGEGWSDQPPVPANAAYPKYP